MWNNRLFVASASPSRKKLLEEAGFECVILGQDADEKACHCGQSCERLVVDIARAKMDKVCMPDLESLSKGEQEKGIYILTADTLVAGIDGMVRGKAHSKEDAYIALAEARKGVITYTGYCLQKRCFNKNTKVWDLVEGTMREGEDHAWCTFDVEDDWIERYFAHHSVNPMQVAGTVAIEGFGGLFLRDIKGAYATIIGLPLYKVRKTLDEIGFFED